MADKRITDLQLVSEFDETLNLPIDDGIQTYRATGQQLKDFLNPIYQGAAGLLKNVGLQCVANTGAMTVALKQNDGTSNPEAGLDITEVTFRSTTLTSGGQTLISFDEAMSLTIPSGATLGFANGQNARVFVYLYYDGTNKGVAVSARDLDERRLFSLTEIGTDADSSQAIYADANRTGAAVRKIGEFSVDAITTAGTWTTATYVSVHSPLMFEHGVRIYDASSTVSSPGTYMVTTGSSDITMTISSGIVGPIKIVKADTGTGKVIIAATIDGATNVELTGKGDWYELIADGANYKTLSEGIKDKLANQGSVVTGISNTVSTYADTSLYLPPGLYIMEFGGCFRVDGSGLATHAYGRWGLWDASTSGSEIVAPMSQNTGLPQQDTNNRRGYMYTKGELTWTGGIVYLRGLISTTGGSGISRDLAGGRIRATWIRRA